LFRRRQLLQTLILGTAVAQAQSQPLTEPEDVGVLCRQEGSNFRSLEMHNAVTSSDFDFFGGQLTYVTIPGRESPCRYRSGEPVVFYLRVFLDLADPRAAFFPVKDPTRFSLFSLQRERHNRRLLLKDDGLTDTRRFAGAPLLARLHATSSFRMTPSDPLGPGEYAVKYSFPDDDRYRLFCFGVDGS
jgi:hypothetical protein